MLIAGSSGAECDERPHWRNSDVESLCGIQEFARRLPSFFDERMRNRQCLAETCWPASRVHWAQTARWCLDSERDVVQRMRSPKASSGSVTGGSGSWSGPIFECCPTLYRSFRSTLSTNKTTTHFDNVTRRTLFYSPMFTLHFVKVLLKFIVLYCIKTSYYNSTDKHSQTLNVLLAQTQCRTCRVSRCILVADIIINVVMAVAVAVNGDISDAVNNLFVCARLVIVIWVIIVINIVIPCNRWWLVSKLCRCLCTCATVITWLYAGQCQFGASFETLCYVLYSYWVLTSGFKCKCIE